jgi:hypothetical protein
MGDAINLADPDFEPTDEQLKALSRAAFAGVRERHEAILVKMRAEIAERRAQLLAELRERQAAERNGK